MMRAATEAAAKSKNRPLVLAVTVLTSLADSDLQEIGVAGRSLDQVLRLAGLARANGCDGVVASPAEAAELRREMGTGFLIVTPGVRPAGSAQNDQARLTTPAEAITSGATHLVVGRPITAAADPAAAARAVLDEMEAASKNLAPL
jgi:orotidine-5'-phosphate decarboxylase